MSGSNATNLNCSSLLYALFQKSEVLDKQRVLIARHIGISVAS